MEVISEIGKKIRQLRTRRYEVRMTQEELAELAGISVSFLSMIERGERSAHVATLASLASALEVPLAELFAFEQGSYDVEPTYLPLVEFCEEKGLTRKDVERLVMVAEAMFS